MKSHYRPFIARYVAIPALILSYCIVNSCQLNGDIKAAVPAATNIAVTEAPAATPPTTHTADAATVLGRPEVPILCYHQVRDWRATDSKTARDYIVPPANFKEQMK